MTIFRYHPAGAVGSGRVFLRMLSFMLCALLMTGLFPATVSAYAIPTCLRVGLQRQFNERERITLSNTALWVGYRLNESFIPLGMIQSAAGFTAQPENGVCVQAPGLYTTYEQALTASSFYNNSAYSGVYAPALSAYGEWQVYGTQFASEATARNEAAALGGSFCPASNKRVTLYAGGILAGIFDNDPYTVQIKDALGGLVSLGGTTYRGAVELGRYAGQKLTAVNVLSVDEYLCSVVPSEMSASFQPEALKAQAVAARSYTLTRMGVHQSQGYDLCDQSHCQNYQGAGNENTAATQAITETSGVLACYEGQPINAVFFSSSGGATDDSENVWTNPLPYLRSVNEISEFEPRVWTRTFTMNEITSLLAQQNIAIGTATAVAITRTSPSGRVQELTIYGSLGTKVLTKEAIRSFFSASAGGTLESRNFTLADGIAAPNTGTAAVTDGGQTQERMISAMYALSQYGELTVMTAASATDGKTVAVYGSAQPVVSTGNGVILTGRGWGHGVGMSQRGAEGMARLGFDYIAILKHYYTGITVE